MPRMPALDAFVQPEEPTAAEAIAAIGDELAVFDDWMDRYQFIIELGRKLPPFPEHGPTTRIACPAARARCGWKPCCAGKAVVGRRPRTPPSSPA